MNNKVAITLTFSECVENHAGMQKIGEKLGYGLTLKQIIDTKNKFENIECTCELYNLSEMLREDEVYGKDNVILDVNEKDAYILIIRNGVDALLKKYDATKEKLMDELTAFKWDTKAIMRGKVVNKHARENVCFAEEYQAPDINQGKGTVLAFRELEHLNNLRNELIDTVLPGFPLLAEGNKYNDVRVNGIGFHGDTERSIVVAARLGATFPLEYQWFLRFKPVGNRMKFSLNSGDIYLMSEKAVGCDWKKSSKLTLRHAAGADKYLLTK